MVSRRIAAKTVGLMLLFAACSKRGEISESNAYGGEQKTSAVVARLAGDATAAASPGLSKQQALQPMVIRTADVRVTATDVSKLFVQLTKMAESRGGYVTTSRQWSENERAHATLVVRVPAAQLMDFLVAVRAVATHVDSEQVHGDDVTQEFVDLNARLRNHEATELELRELLKSIRQNARKAAEVLEVHREMVAIRSEIEQIKGRLQYISQMTSLSTITIAIAQDAVAKPMQSRWQPVGVFRDAVRALVSTGEAIANVLIWGVVYFLPIVLLFVAVALGLRAIVRAGRRSSSEAR